MFDENVFGFHRELTPAHSVTHSAALNIAYAARPRNAWKHHPPVSEELLPLTASSRATGCGRKNYFKHSTELESSLTVAFEVVFAKLGHGFAFQVEWRMTGRVQTESWV